MGVYGLSTYLRDNHRTCGSVVVLDHESKSGLSKPLVVDGWSFIYFLRNDQTYKEPWVYGGEYDYFSRVARFVVRAWLKLFPQVYFVFDGAHPEIKFPVIIKRIQDSRIMPANLFWRTSAERRNQSSFQRQNKILPVLAYQACVSALQDLVSEGVQCIWANDEADRRCVELAGDLSGWVAGTDSDFAVLNVDGYAGYIPLDEMVWTASALSEEEDEVVSDQEEDGWSGVKSKKKKQKNKSDGTTRIGIIPPSDNIATLTIRVYHPNDLAQHLGIRPPFLPLFASLVGNDFIPESYRARFFPRNMMPNKRIERVAETIRDASSPSKGRKKRATITQESGGVAALIDQAVQKLLLRDDVASGQIEEMVETIIESILQYVVDSDLRGPFTSKPKSPKHLYQSDVELKYTEAFRRGEFSPRVLDLVTSGTCWTNLGLEDPDAETVTRTVGEEATVWIGAVLSDGIPIGVEEIEDMASTGTNSVLGNSGHLVRREETDEEDEDELISVVEDDSSNETERSLSRRRFREEEFENEDDEDDDNVYSDYPPFTNGVPVAMLTSALKRLRREQKRTLPSDSSRLQSPKTVSSFVSTPAPDTDTSTSLGPVSITTYFRRGGRITPASITIPPLAHLISSTSRGRSSSKSGLKVNWQGPIQLQPLETRLKLFLHAVHCNTPAFRNLDEEWLLIAVALRWVVIKMCEKMSAQLSGGGGGGNLKWKKSEARAFLLSCVRTYLADTLTDSPGGIMGGSMMASVSDWSMLATPTAASSFIFVAGQTTLPPPPLEATTHAIQMSAQILVSIEKCHQLAQVLLLSKRVSPAERKFSGRTFHALLKTIQEERMTPEESEIFDKLWNAVEEDGRAEWWAEESISKKEKKKVKKAAKAQATATTAPTRGRSKTVTAPGGMFGALAEVTM